VTTFVLSTPRFSPLARNFDDTLEPTLVLDGLCHARLEADIAGRGEDPDEG
jgi:hypothetical protein